MKSPKSLPSKLKPSYQYERNELPDTLQTNKH